jgi:hypothetical protein
MKKVPEYNAPMPQCGYPPISTASTDFGSVKVLPGTRVIEYLARTFNANGDPEYWLIPDPRTWERRQVRPGVWVVVRPKPIRFEPIERPSMTVNHFADLDF